jgi:hypothetical protein
MSVISDDVLKVHDTEVQLYEIRLFPHYVTTLNQDATVSFIP